MEPDGVLGAGHHAQPAGPAVVGVGGVGGLVAVGPNLEPGQATEGVEVGIVDPAHLEHVVGTHDDAVALALASGVVDHRSPGARGRGTPLTRTIRMSGGPSLLSNPMGSGAIARGFVGGVFGQDLVDLAPGVVQDPVHRGDLLGAPGLGHLHDGRSHLEGQVAQVDQ